MEMFSTPEFWIAVGQIILIDILLGGDNAVVIALACRSLPPEQRTKGILWGTAGAIVLRVVLIFFALTLLQIPFLKIVGGLLLMWIGVKLLLPEQHGGGHGEIAASDKLWGAVKTVVIADLVMSVDNVIAIAGAAESAGGEFSMPLVVFGLVVSIPIIVWGSQFVLKLMDRYPVVITIGGMLLGWIAGTMAVTDPVLSDWVPHDPTTSPPDVLAWARYGTGLSGALLVLALGKWFAAQQRKAAAATGTTAADAAGSAGAAAAGALRSILVAVDGSEGSRLAVQRAVTLRQELRAGADLQIHLVNVQRPLSNDVSRFIPGKTIGEYHEENSEVLLARAREQLGAAAAIATQAHPLVGEPANTIADAARSLGCQLIVMGARGMGANAAALLGSVTQSTIAQATVPVLVAK